MKLIKVTEGDIELNNYFIETPIGDMLGEFIGSKEKGRFHLRKGFVERPFPFDEYVIIVKKEPIELIGKNNYKLYTRFEDRIHGILEIDEDEGKPYSYWKLIRYDKFIQGYMSHDNKKWEHKGGMDDFVGTNIQGFAVEGQELIINDYRVYRSPYITLFNIPEGYYAIGYDANDNPVLEKRNADYNGIIELFVEHIIPNGKIKIFDDMNELVYEEDNFRIQYGDQFLFLEHDLALFYNNIELEHTPPTLLTKRLEKVVLKNLSEDTTYERVLVSVLNENVDRISISLDNEVFDEELEIPKIEPNEEIDIYIRIRRKPKQPSFQNKLFYLDIDNY